jgi:hypothetical protein
LDVSIEQALQEFLPSSAGTVFLLQVEKHGLM